ncbi:hypothetical protein VIBNIAM115_430013 [Vibrio nigripulchritudo AM115]|nr:hypothetical protein VIBNIAM115_430013 [Vibrio nigripulchritudo AM115]
MGIKSGIHRCADEILQKWDKRLDQFLLSLLRNYSGGHVLNT